MIERFYDKTISTKRLLDVADTDKEVFTTYKTGIKCAIQQTTDEKVFIDDKIYQQFRMYCDDSEDIIEHDYVINGSDEYVVRAVNKMTVGNIPHLEIVLLKAE